VKNYHYILAVLLLVIGGCSVKPRHAEGERRIISDMAGRTVDIPAEIRSVYTGRHPVHAVYAFDTAMTVNNVFRYSETEKRYLKPSFYEGKPYALEDASEEIVRLKPDIILMADYLTPEYIERVDLLQEKVQIPVVTLDNDFLHYDRTLTFMGELFHQEEHAAEMVAFIRKYVFPVIEQAKTIPPERRKRIYYAEGMRGLNTDPSGSVHSMMIDLAGGINIAQTDVLSGKGMTGVSMEQILSWNPDIILVWSGNFDGMDSYREILTSEIWQRLDAVKRGEVYQVPWKPFGWIDRPPGLNRLIGLLWLAKQLYPDEFQYDMVEVAQEFFRLFWHYEMSAEEAAGIINPKPHLSLEDSDM